MADMNRSFPAHNNGKQSKSEMVYNYLLDGINSGVWLPGERINDKDVSEHLGVNRLAVREALSRLIENDIVEQPHWKGYHVRFIDTEYISSIVEVRIALEVLAIKLLLKKPETHKEDYFDKMQESIDKQRKYIEYEDQSYYLDVDFRFHELLYESSGNEKIGKIIGNIMIVNNLLRNVSMGKSSEDFMKAALKSTNDHQELLDAFKENDYRKAKRLLKKHIGKTFVENINNNLESVEE